jgi:glucose-6-phosphate isomerase
MKSKFFPLNIKYSANPPSFAPNDLVIKRTLSQMRDAFFDQKAVDKQIVLEDKPIVDVYMAPVPSEHGHFMSLMTIVYPGTVGDECFMTMGHIHTDFENAPEVYITLKGQGLLVMQTVDGETSVLDMVPGELNYIPSGWAHRSINTGDEPLVFLGIYTADAVRDYSFIGVGKENFHKCVVKRGGKVEVINHPGFPKASAV